MKRILICDDEELVVALIRVKITEEKLGEVIVARDGLQALTLLREQNFDLVITDIHMPYHNGEEILKLIRVDQKKNTPIVMISSDGEEEVIALAKKLGVNEFLTKPIKPKEIAKLVKRLLKD